MLDSHKKRLVGLMFSKEKEFTKPLLFDFKRNTVQCKIHSFFCFFEFDAIWLDENRKVVFLREKIKPWRYGIGPEKARFLIEARKGTIKKFKIEKGDYIQV